MKAHILSVIAAAVDFPVAWGSLGAGVGTPRAALFQVGGPRDMHMRGKGVIFGRVQVDAYGKDMAEVEHAAEQLRAALEGYRGGPVLGVFLQAVRDQDDEDAGLLRRVSMTFSVTYRE